MKHVMLDLETLSTEANAVILSIGACWFDPHGEEFRRETPLEGPGDYPYDLTKLNFRANINLQSCIDVGMGITGSTVRWWADQSEKARQDAFGGETPIREALNDLTDFIKLVSINWPDTANVEPDEVCVWGHGPAFDNAIIANACHRLGYRLPWSFRNDRCNRTFLALAKDRGVDIPLVRLGTFHNALDDAITQAMHMQRVNATLRLKDILLPGEGSPLPPLDAAVIAPPEKGKAYL